MHPFTELLSHRIVLLLQAMTKLRLATVLEAVQIQSPSNSFLGRNCSVMNWKPNELRDCLHRKRIMAAHYQ